MAARMVRAIEQPVSHRGQQRCRSTNSNTHVCVVGYASYAHLVVQTLRLANAGTVHIERESTMHSYMIPARTPVSGEQSAACRGRASVRRAVIRATKCVVERMESRVLLSIALAPESGLSASGDTLAVMAGATVNVALNRPAVASTIETSGLVAGNATDGSTSTRWSSNAFDPQWIYVDLGQNYDINRVVLRWETAYGKDFQIQVSNDASTWTTITSVTGGTGGVNDLSGLSGTGRYVRMYGTARGTKYGYSLWEFEVYGTVSAVQPPNVAYSLLATSLSTTNALDGQTVTLGYQITSPATTDAVLSFTLTGPGGVTAPDVGSRVSITVQPGTNWYYRDILIDLPPNAPAGAYSVTGRVSSLSGVAVSFTNQTSLNIATPVAVPVPILIYHSVGPIAYSQFYITTAAFQSQMQSLHDNGYTTITLTDWANIRAGLEAAPAKPVIITFDDGLDNLLTVAYPILASFGFKATSFVPTEYVGGTNAWDVGAIAAGDPVINELTWSQIQQLAATGLIDFQSHSMTHPDLTSVSDSQLAWELAGSKQALEANLPGHLVNFIAYPFGTGAGDARAENATYAAGYFGGIAAGGGVDPGSSDKFNLLRVEVYTADTGQSFLQKLGGPIVQPPAAPTLLTATAISSSQVNLSWTDNSTTETGFAIDYATDVNFTQNLLTTTVGANSGATASASITGLSASMPYYFRVRATNGGGASANSNTASATTLAVIQPPAAPTLLTATATSSSQVNLNWTDNSTNETGFAIDYATDVNFTQNLITTTVGANSGASASASIAGLSASTPYYFRVRATNSGGASANTNTASATTLAVTEPPAAPTVLTATAASSGQINLSWTDNATTETGFAIDYATDVNFTQNLLTATVGANSGASASASITGLSPTTTYYFQVRAVNAIGASANSNTASATTLAGIQPPAAPTALLATAVSSGQINLSWTDNASDESGFAIDYATDVNFTQNLITTTVGASSGTSASASITGLSPSTTYYFRVRATNGGGASANSNIANATTSALATQRPAAPTALAATAVSESQINLSWKDNSTNETGFAIDRATNSKFTKNLVTTRVLANSGASASASITGLSPSTTYYFRVRATNAIGASGNSNTVNATTTAATQPPAAPTLLSATAVSSSQINLTWTDNATTETGFAIDRATDVNFTQNLITTTVGTNITSTSITGLSPSTTYYFQVRATNAIGPSANSNTASATTLVAPQPPAAPTLLSATAVSSGQINLAWTDNASDETGFAIDRATDVNFTQNLITTTVGANSGTSASASITGLSPSTTYYFRVRATNGGGASGNSNTANATTSAAVVSSNLALGQPTFASSVEDATFPASNATDGNGSTRWSSLSSDPQWIYVDLGQSYNISRVVLKWETAYGKDFQIQVSSDASTWTTITAVTGGTGGGQ